MVHATQPLMKLQRHKLSLWTLVN